MSTTPMSPLSFSSSKTKRNSAARGGVVEGRADPAHRLGDPDGVASLGEEVPDVRGLALVSDPLDLVLCEGRCVAPVHHRPGIDSFGEGRSAEDDADVFGCGGQVGGTKAGGHEVVDESVHRCGRLVAVESVEEDDEMAERV